MAKRARRSPEGILPEPPFTSVVVVCRTYHEITDLLHVAQSMSDFLDTSSDHWTFEQVSDCELADQSAVGLLGRLLMQEWSGLSENFRVARCRHNVQQLRERPLLADWWLTKYLPLTETSLKLIVKYAIRHNRINVLKWLEKEGALPRPEDGLVKCERAEAAYWLDKRGYKLSVYAEPELEECNQGFLQWLSENEDRHELYNVERGLAIAAMHNNAKLMQWLFGNYPDIEWEEPSGSEYSKRDL